MQKEVGHKESIFEKKSFACVIFNLATGRVLGRDTAYLSNSAKRLVLNEWYMRTPDTIWVLETTTPQAAQHQKSFFTKIVDAVTGPGLHQIRSFEGDYHLNVTSAFFDEEQKYFHLSRMVDAKGEAKDSKVFFNWKLYSVPRQPDGVVSIRYQDTKLAFFASKGMKGVGPDLVEYKDNVNYWWKIVPCNEIGSNVNWMRDMGRIIGNRPLNQIALPGSKESATYSFTSSSTASAEEDSEWINKSLFQWPATSFCASWFRKQSHTIEEQLRDGIRYLQFRLIKHSDGALYVTNKLLGPKIEEVLEEVKTFVQQNREEIIFLDFVKFFAMDKDAHMQLKELLLQVFSGHLVPRMRGPRVTPNQLWNLKESVLVIYGDETECEGTPFFPPGVVSCPKPDLVQSTSQFVTFLNETLNDRTDDGFFISHGTYSSKPNAFANSFAPFQSSTTKSLADYCNPAVIDWIVDENHTKFFNIVLLDFYERSSLIHTLKIANEYMYSSITRDVSESVSSLFMVEEKMNEVGESIRNAANSVSTSISSTTNPFDEKEMAKAVLATPTGRKMAASVVTNAIANSNPFL